MAVTPEWLLDAASRRLSERARTPLYRYEAAKKFVNLITSSHMPTLDGLRIAGYAMSDGKVKEAYHIYFLLTTSSKHSKHNADRIYKMIHG
jgi:hypothetical protein